MALKSLKNTEATVAKLKKMQSDQVPDESQEVDAVAYLTSSYQTIMGGTGRRRDMNIGNFIFSCHLIYKVCFPSNRVYFCTC